MARIRDLGINVIPATMRPLEIGPGAAIVDPGGAALPLFLGSNCQICACEGGSNAEESSCNPSGCDEDDDDDQGPGRGKDKDKDKKLNTGGFTEEAVMQLRQQLRSSIGSELVQ